MKPQTRYASEMAWEKFTGFPGTAEAKILRDEGSDKAKSMLVRLPPGGQVTPHTHMATVQHYILEGDYESYKAGTYRLLPGHSDVAPISTRNGVTVLFIYDPVH